MNLLHRSRYLFTTTLGLTAAISGSSALGDVFYTYGPSNTYSDTSTNRELEMEDGTTNATTANTSRAFNTTSMAPEAGGYTGPDFFGGWKATGSMNQTMGAAPRISNNDSTLSGFDGPRFDLNATSGSAGSFAFLMLGDITNTAYNNLESIVLGASRSGGSGNYAVAYAVVAVDNGSGVSYYVSQQTVSISSSYGVNTLDIDGPWNSYDPGVDLSNVSGTAATLNATDTITYAGSLVVRGLSDGHSSTSARLSIGQLTVNAAVPEPGSCTLVGLGSLLMFRRRKA